MVIDSTSIIGNLDGEYSRLADVSMYRILCIVFQPAINSNFLDGPRSHFLPELEEIPFEGDNARFLYILDGGCTPRAQHYL